MNLLKVEEALERIRQGKQIILIDDEDRENEGDLCMAAEKVTPADINFMARHGRGLICLTLTPDRVAHLGLDRMAQRNETRFGTDFCVSIEAREGVTTGISASDRAKTIAAAVSPSATSRDIVTPGHVFPICARPGGVLVRCGQTEGSVDLARLAGLEPAGVICEIMNDDGSMARRDDLCAFAATHNLGMLTIAQIIEYRLQRDRLIEAEVDTEVRVFAIDEPFRLRVFRSLLDNVQYLALVKGSINPNEPTLVRVHRAQLTSDLFGIVNPVDSMEPRKNEVALNKIAAANAGVFLYILPGNIDLSMQWRKKADTAARTLSGDTLREFGLGAQVLKSLGVSKISLMTDHPKRIPGLNGFGIEIVDIAPIA